MKLTKLHVQNYRGLRDVELPLSQFGCFIGKNNAGKSTVLQAVSLFFSGTRLNSKDYFDPADPIRIEITFEDISDVDLGRLAPEHRDKIENIVDEGVLKLVRSYDKIGSSKLMYVKLVPSEERFQPDAVAQLIKGKKAGKLVEAVVGQFPELQDKFQPGNVNQTKIKEAIEELTVNLPPEQKTLADSDLPTGIDASIRGLLPEPIYIAAVKNLADDVKVKESTPFGKVLSILLSAIEPKLGDVNQFFAALSEKFNLVFDDDGNPTDNRLPEVQKIERTVEDYLRESFAHVNLQINIPPPELKTILSSAELLIDDGIKGTIESKGDGLRRATVFAILRSYVALNQPGALSDSAQTTLTGRYILLFEEPELYLHPSAQKVLFDALSVFSTKNHVLITTHSPSFFGPQGTASFTKLSKVPRVDQVSPPYTAAHPIDLSDLTAKDQFQLICFENNNAAFFFDSVILVEGDSDYIVFPHLAQLLTNDWDRISPSHKFIRLSGKGSIRRYREFFSKFAVRVAIVTDLDLLTGGFEVINPSENLRKSHSALMSVVDGHIEYGNGFSAPTQKQVKSAQGKTELLGLWKHVKQAWQDVQAGDAEFSDLEKAVEDFFAWEKRNLRLKVLQECQEPDVVTAKSDLLEQLRLENVYVLERGALEAYYPAEIKGKDKPSKAQDFCKKIVNKDQALALCGEIVDKDGINLGKEFDVLCAAIFQH